MIIGQTEGYLSGTVVLKLSKRISKAVYKIKYEIKDTKGDYYTFLPPFPVLQHENYVEFSTFEYSDVYMRVTVEYIEEPTTGIVPPPCSPCNSLI